jgi:hypothetical protein
MSRSLVINESGNVKGSCHRQIGSNITEIPGRTQENHCQASHSLCTDYKWGFPKYAAGMHVIWGLHSTADGDASLLTFVTFDQMTWHHIQDDLSPHKAGILPTQLGPTVLFPSLLNHALTSTLVLSVFLKSSRHHTGIHSRILWHNIPCSTLQLSTHTHFYLCICITQQEKYFLFNGLVFLVQSLEGRYTTTDLRNESWATGKIEQVDVFMNTVMSEAVLIDTRGNEY